MDEVISLLFTFWHIVRRRKWFAVGAAWGVCMMGWVGVATLPDQYESRAQIYVDTASLLRPLLRGIAVQQDLDQQLSVMKRTLFSRPNLEKVVRDNDLDLEVETSKELEDLLVSVAERASIRTAGRNLFTVGFTDQDPILAKDITKSFLEIFISTNVGNNRRGMETARSFIDNQISKYENQLKAAETRLAEFRAKHAEMLSGGSFFTRYETARREVKGAQRELDDILVVRELLEDQLSETPRFLEMAQATEAGGRSAVREKSDAEKEVDRLEKKLADLRTQYTESHPDMISGRQLLAEAEKRLEEERRSEAEAAAAIGVTPGKTQIPNVVYEQLRSRLTSAEEEQLRIENFLKRANQEFDELSQLKESSPVIEAELAGLNRDYDVIKAQYEELLERREAASISAAQEASTDAVQFRIVEPPEVPAKPVGPKRMIFNATVLVAGLAIGVALPILFALISGCFYGQRQLEEAFDLPVIGSVSYISSSLNRAGSMINAILILIILMLLFAAFGLVVFYAPNPTSLGSVEELVNNVLSHGDVKYYLTRIKELLQL